MNIGYIKNVFSMLRASEIGIHLNRFNYTLESEFEGNSVRLDSTCSKGHKISFSVQQLVNGKGCKFCKDKLEPINLTSFSYFKSNLEIRHLQEKLKEIQFDIIDKSIDYEIFNVDKPLSIVCSNGHKIKRTYYQIINREQRCRKCYYKHDPITDLKTSYTETEVQNILEEEGCKLLTPYISDDTPFIFQCSCGSQGSTTILHFLRKGVRCSYCKASKRKGSMRIKRKEGINWSGTKKEE